ncbi:uncharacterized protein yc1106_05208 [Curvularia clavata]|uniref:5'-3' DNA helicase ZGRF1-like N-terminal domain-containing protein n=1 Tax=Curvularia clavata TaxID=95742 RepID=A0A9Q9DTM4_CURCL|nr:uncharacterized protein yc1106_05208 [Curvularia clavata]
MTAPLRSNQHASAIAAIAASQNTAPVAEFRCLFTHDVRRKQKRWHDGFLKFHSFNNRVMVYDLARTFLGDTYHKDSDELHEGDELALNNGLLVEVSEPVGISHTDLTSLLSKKTKDAPPGPSAHSQTKPFQRPSSVAPSNAQTSGTHLRHKSLNIILGTPKGPIGKAQPIRSPYEVRKEKERENELVQERAAKRQKTGHDDEGLRKQEKLSTLTKTTGTHKARQPPSFIPPAATVITLDSEPDLHPPILSDVTLPSTPPQITKKRQERQKAKTVVAGQPPAQTPKIPRGKVPVPSVRALETPRQPAPPSSPPVSVSNRLSNIEFALQPAKLPRKESSPPPAPSSPPARKTKCLRLATGVKRGKLLCQALPSESAKAGRTASRVVQEQETLPGIGQKDRISNPSKRLPRTKRILADSTDDAPKRMRMSKSPALPSPILQEDPEIVHGHMDQQLLVASSPVHSHMASSPPVDAVSMARSPFKKTASKIPLQEKITGRPSADPKAHLTEGTNHKRPARRKAEERERASRASPPVLDPDIPASRDVSPTRSEASETPLQTLPKSRKMTASTGFRKSRSLAKVPVDPIEDEEDAGHGGKPPNRSFRRVRSENDAGAAEEQERDSLSKPSTSPVRESVSEPAMADRAVTKKKKKDSGLDALIKRTDPRRKFKRMQRLEIETNVALLAGVEAEEGEVELDSPVEDVDVGPWSTEAGDLFDWRPLGRD